ncbi:MAG TPA: hypothetical protein VMH04_03615 [Candidatus Solibacter sp.]|nr:hypothetical protein [Candidatus Solibacter sp.]
MSRDLEDVITVIDGRIELIDEISQSVPEIRQYLCDEFRALLSNREFLDALPGHLLPDEASQQRIGLIVERMRKLISMG